MRYFIQLSYNGTDFHGWQIQDTANSVQEEINKALSTILQSEINVVGCGRTDAGVHAKEFYAHFDQEIALNIDTDLFIHKLNTILPWGIAIQNLLVVTPEAHARFDATKRTYEYLILRDKDPFRNNLGYKFNVPLDLDSMNKACQLLLGEHDFGSFCKANTDNFTNLCNVSEANWREIDNMLVFTIAANRFLRNMVRAIVGTMLDIGQGKTSVDNLKTIIASKDRTAAGRSVPAQGLYLTKVEYPSQIFVKNN